MSLSIEDMINIHLIHLRGTFNDIKLLVDASDASEEGKQALKDAIDARHDLARAHLEERFN